MLVTQIASSLGMGTVQYRVSIYASDLNALPNSAGAKTFNLVNVGGNATNPLVCPQGGKILGVQQHLVTSFSGGTLSAVTLSIGKSGGSATFLTAAFDIFQASGDTAVQESAGLFKSGQNSQWTLNATVTPTGDNAANATAGQVDVYIWMIAPTTTGA